MTPAAFSLAGKTVVVTGGASGLGRVYAEALANAGAALVLTDLVPAAVESLAKDLQRQGARVVGVAGDISQEATAERIAEAAREAFGDVDGLVNNAALMSALPRRSWLEIPAEEWDKVMAVNLKGPFLLCRALYPLMRKRGGSIVNIASTRAFDGTPNRLHYTTSKAGVVGFTRALARELGAEGIRVNAIAPGITLSETQIASSDPAYLDKLAEGRALPRQQTPKDLVGAMLFLLADESSFVTGQTLVVDGGKVMR